MATAAEPHEPPLRVSPEAGQLGRRIAIHVSAGRYGIAEQILAEAIARQQRDDRVAGEHRASARAAQNAT